MADGFLHLLLLVTLMFLGSVGIGYLPVLANLKEHHLELVSISGAGFLLGTAMIVIIPEGLTVLLEVAGVLAPHFHEHDGEHQHEHHSDSSDDGDSHGALVSSHDPIVHGVFQKMGLIVCIGFIFMAVIEKISVEYGSPTHDHSVGHSHGHSHEHSHKHSGGAKHSEEEMLELEPLTSKSTTHSRSTSKLLTSVTTKPSSPKAVKGSAAVCTGDLVDDSGKGSSQESMISLMTGLLTHSAIDGVALGAVSAESSTTGTLSLLVFVALMTHKCPAAVSLTAFLKRKGTPRTRLLQQLMIFSASAPVCALLTYFILDSLIGTVLGVPLANSELLGWCLLFSGGTFLSVVTLHIIPEAKQWSATGQLSVTQIALFTVGCVLPAFVEHSHG